MNGWFIALVSIYGIELLLSAYMHKKPRKGEWNFWSSLLIIAIMVFLATMAVY